MKRLAVLLALLVLPLAHGCGVFRPFRENVAVFQERATEAEFAAWAESMRGADAYTSAQNLAAWGKASMVYEADGFINYPRHYLVTFKRRSGNCNDFSSMYMAALMRLGYDAQMLSVFRSQTEGHAVCAFQQGGLFYHISNWYGFVAGYNVSTMRDLAATVYPDWAFCRVWDFDMNQVGGDTR